MPAPIFLEILKRPAKMILGRHSDGLMSEPDGRSISFLPGRGLGSDNVCIARISLIASPMDLLAGCRQTGSRSCEQRSATGLHALSRPLHSDATHFAPALGNSGRSQRRNGPA